MSSRSRVLADGAVELVAKDESSEGAGDALPVFSERFETDVLREQQTPKRIRANKQVAVFEFRRAVLLRGQNIQAPASQFRGDGDRNMNVEVKRGHPVAARRAATRRRRKADGVC